MACPQSRFESNRAPVGWNPKKTQWSSTKANNCTDLSVAFLRLWAAIPMVFIKRLIHPMYRRCVSVVNAEGIHTRYWLVTPQLMPAMLYAICTSGNYEETVSSPWWRCLQNLYFPWWFHLKNKHTDTKYLTDISFAVQYIYIYIYIYTHTHTHTHIYIYTDRQTYQ